MLRKRSLPLTLISVLVATPLVMVSQSMSTPESGERFSGAQSPMKIQRDLATAKAAVKAKRASASLVTSTNGKPSQNKSYSFLSVDYPGAANSSVYDWNGRMAVGLSSQSFTFTGSDYAAFNIDSSADTITFGINSQGVIVGAYVDLLGVLHGFSVRGKTTTTVDFPGSVETAVTGVNDAGDLVGIWYDAAGNEHSFMRHNGVSTSLDYPGALSTEASGINAAGEIVGAWTDASSVSHGFILSGGGYTTLDVPLASSTTCFGLNNRGEIAGYYQDASSTFHGFLYSKNTFTTVDVDGAVGGTMLTRINNAEQLAGLYIDVLGEEHGLTAH